MEVSTMKLVGAAFKLCGLDMEIGLRRNMHPHQDYEDVIIRGTKDPPVVVW